jgi:hypothetical protein
MLTVKVTAVGSSSAIVLDQDAVAWLGVHLGDLLCLTEAPGGAYRLTPYSPEFERQMELAEQVMHEDRDILRALAKWSSGAGLSWRPSMPSMSEASRNMAGSVTGRRSNLRWPGQSISPHMGTLTPQTWRQHTPSAWHAIRDSRTATNVRRG